MHIPCRTSISVDWEWFCLSSVIIILYFSIYSLHASKVEQLSGASHIELAELLIKGIKEGKHLALDLFPKILSIIAAQEKIQYQKGQSVSSSCLNYLMRTNFECNFFYRGWWSQ